MQICAVHPGGAGFRESECTCMTSGDGSTWKQMFVSVQRDFVKRDMLGLGERLDFLFSSG